MSGAVLPARELAGREWPPLRANVIFLVVKYADKERLLVQERATVLPETPRLMSQRQRRRASRNAKHERCWQ